MSNENQFYKITDSSANDMVIMDVDGFIGFDEIEIDFENWTFTKKYPNSVNTAKKTQDFLNSIQPLKGKNLIININNCPGGYVDDALMMVEKIKSVGFKKVITNIAGLTASAATILAQSATPGGRRQSKNSLQLIHKAQNIAFGNTNDIQAMIEELIKVDDLIANTYVRDGSLTKDDYINQMNANNGYGEWLTPDEALQMKLIDEIYEPENKYRFQNSILKGELKTFKLPEIPKEKLTNLIIDMENQELTNQKLSFLEKIIDFFTKDKPENKLENFEDFQAQIEAIENAKNTEIQNLTEKQTELLNQIEALQTEADKATAMSDEIAQLKASLQTETEAKETAIKLQETAENELKEMKTNFDAGQRGDGSTKGIGKTDPKFVTAEAYKEQKNK